MSSTASLYAPEQFSLWMRALLALAWADGDFDVQEQQLLATLTEQEVTPITLSPNPVTPVELAAGFGQDQATIENFLRTAVMVALADGIYSEQEDRLLQDYCHALGQPCEFLTSLRTTLVLEAKMIPNPMQPSFSRDALSPVRDWLDRLEVHDPKLARFLCKLIPSQCPFERDINLFGHKVVHIPPMCKINPLYEQLVGLRFRALCYLADVCGEDVTRFC